MQSETPSVFASAPFNKKNADIIFRSSDGVSFRLHKIVLILASPFMEDMLSMPQPSTPDHQDMDHTSGLPVVHVSEDGPVLDVLLRFCYPTPDPVLQDPWLIEAVLSGAHKYQMADAIERIKRAILSDRALPDQTVRVYAIACRLQLEDVARAAAVASCQWSTVNYAPDMDKISSGALFRLLLFRRNHQRPPGSFVFCCPEAPTNHVAAASSQSTSDRSQVPRPSISTIFQHPDADVIVRSSDHVDFEVFKSILMLASPVFAELLNKQAEQRNLSETGLPIVCLAEDSETVSNLLQVCYPTAEPEIKDLDGVRALLECGFKYRVTSVVRFAKKKWTQLVPTDPLRAYFIAMAKGWTDEAREAARRGGVSDNDRWIPEMEQSAADMYRQLLDYRWTRQQIIYTHCGGIDPPLGLSTDKGLSKPRHWSSLGYEASEDKAVGVDKVLLDLHCKLPAAVSGTDADALITALIGKATATTLGRASPEKLIWDVEGLVRELEEASSRVTVDQRATFRASSVVARVESYPSFSQTTPFYERIHENNRVLNSRLAQLMQSLQSWQP